MSGMSLKAGVERLARSRRLSFLVLLVVILAAYHNMFQNDFIMDDFDFIVNWPLIRDIRNLPRFFWGYIPPDGQDGIYSPLRTLFFALNYMFWGPNPLGFHLLGLLTHILGTWAVYLIATRLLRDAPTALLTALLFAVHPLHVESVSAMTGSIDTIGVVFSLFAFYYFIQAVGYSGKLSVSRESLPETPPAAGPWGLQDRRAYITALVLALLAIFTHELTVALPLVFLFYDLLFRGPRAPWPALVRRHAPFFGMVFVYVVLKALVLGGICRGYYLMGSFRAHMLVIIKAWFKYVWLILFPVVSSHDHVISPGILSFNENDFSREAVFAQSFLDPQVLYSLAGLAAVVFLALWSFRRKPVVSFGIGWFFLCLSPVSGIVPSSVFFAERYLYAASLGFCMMAAYYLQAFVRGAKEPQAREQRLAVTVAVMVGVMTFYGAKVFLRNQDGLDQITVYEASIRNAPQSAYLLNDLGIIYSRAGRYEEAVKSFEEAIRRRPNEAHFYFSAEGAYSGLKRFPEAIVCLQKAIAINPDFAEAHYNLAGLYAHLNKEQEALDHLGKALTLYRNQGRIYEAGEAKQMFEEYLYRKKHPEAAQRVLNKIFEE